MITAMPESITAQPTVAIASKRLVNTAAFASLDKPYALAEAITLVLVFAYGPKESILKCILSGLAVAGLALKPVRRAPQFWFLIFSLAAWAVYLDRFAADNHKYLLAYWVLAFFVALQTAEKERSLATSARWLIAAVMTLAVLQKVTTPDFVDGSFFHHALLFDPRFKLIRELLAVPQEVIEGNRASVQKAIAAVRTAAPPTAILTTAGARVCALIITWWTLLIEGLIAVSFLVPTTSRLGRHRDLPLLAFIFSTYAVANVIGFGYVLAAMGIAQARNTTYRLGFLISAIALQVYAIHWRLYLG